MGKMNKLGNYYVEDAKKGDVRKAYYYCPHCGSNVVAKEHTYKCAVCGTDLIDGPGYLMILQKLRYHNNGTDYELKEVKAQEWKNYPEDELIEMVSTFDSAEEAVEKCDRNFGFLSRVRTNEILNKKMRELDCTDAVYTNSFSPDYAQKVKSSPEILCSYLRHLATIESEIISVKQRLRQLYIAENNEEEELRALRFKAINTSVGPQEELIKEKIEALENEIIVLSQEYSHREIELNNKIAELSSEREVLEKSINEYKNLNYSYVLSKPEPPIEPKEPKKPVLQEAGLFNKKKIQKENDALICQFESEMADYRKQSEQYAIDLEAYKADLALFYEKLKKLKEENEQKHVASQQKVELLREQEEQLTEQKKQEDIKRFQQRTELKSQINALVKELEPARQKHHKELEKNPDSLLPASVLVKKSLVEDEIEKAEKAYHDLLKGREELYSVGVVFEKYRDIFAVSSFYEYLISGRCESLEGINGAYNIYENEIRANQIITQLSSVMESLEQIKSNQYLAYSQLKSINNSIIKLGDKMDKAVSSLNSIKAISETTAQYMEEVAHNTEVIAYNTEVTAFYSKKNAELTDALGFLGALK